MRMPLAARPMSKLSAAKAGIAVRAANGTSRAIATQRNVMRDILFISDSLD